MEVVEKSIEKSISSDAEETNESATETPSAGESGGIVHFASNNSGGPRGKENKKGNELRALDLALSRWVVSGCRSLLERAEARDELRFQGFGLVVRSP